jgi:hypothetical protein
MVHPAHFSQELGTGDGAISFAIARAFFTAIGANQKEFPALGWLLTVGQSHLAHSFHLHGTNSSILSISHRTRDNRETRGNRTTTTGVEIEVSTQSVPKKHNTYNKRAVFI